jgi:hypothetical protein
MEGLKTYPEITRVEVIDQNGRALTRYGASDVKVALQDNGTTMKIFLTSSWEANREPEIEVCPYDCDSCHDSDCPCDRLGCAGSQ